jgi:hypothetical protein
MSQEKQTRLELIAALIQLSSIRPEWRMGQTIANLATTLGRAEPSAIWDLEDEDALTAAQFLLKQHAELERSDVA